MRAAAAYAARCIATWVEPYVCDRGESDQIQTQSLVAVQLRDSGYTTFVKAGNHRQMADEPKSVGGSDLGPNPYQYLAAALGSCTAITLRMYTERKGWQLGTITVHVGFKRLHLEDAEGFQDSNKRIDHFFRKI